MDQYIKNIDEIGEETESYTLSTFNQDYYFIKSDYQARGKTIHIPSSPYNHFCRRPGITKADGNHASCSSCFQSISPHHPHDLFLEQSPSASPPYPKKGVYR